VHVTRPTPQVGDTWYRWDEHWYATGYDEDRDCASGSTCNAVCEEWTVAKVTPCGVQLVRHLIQGDVGSSDYWTRRRFVLLNARKRFACPTMEEATESFYARKQCALRYAQRRISRILAEVDAVNSELQYRYKRTDLRRDIDRSALLKPVRLLAG
jgi:hypothetical protein